MSNVQTMQPINQVEVIKPSAVVTPMEMLAQAVEKGMPVETIDKFMALAERWETNQARKAFNEAFANFKAESVTISRNRRVNDGPLKGKSYAELTSFVDAATPALSKHGLSASWDITRDEKDWIEVTCVIEHALGHSKRVSFGGPPDVGGAKNALQARVSTVTYLERATFKAATGLAEKGDDDDGKAGAGVEKITQEQADNLRDLLEANGKTIAKFLKWARVDRIEDIPANTYESCITAAKFKGDTK